MDNGPEFISKALDRWAYENGVKLGFSRPGKLTDNVYVESFNGRLHHECFNARWFLSLDDARAKIELGDGTTMRGVLTSLGWLTPVEYAADTAAQPVNERRMLTLRLNEEPLRLYSEAATF